MRAAPARTRIEALLPLLAAGALVATGSCSGRWGSEVVAGVEVDGQPVEFHRAEHWQGPFLEDEISLFDSDPAGWRIEIRAYAYSYDCDDSCSSNLTVEVIDPSGDVYETKNCRREVEVCFGNVAWYDYDVTEGDFEGEVKDSPHSILVLRGGWFDAVYLGSFWD